MFFLHSIFIFCIFWQFCTWSMLHMDHLHFLQETSPMENHHSGFWKREHEMPFWNAPIVLTIVVGFAAHMILKLKHWRDSTITSHAHDLPHSHVQRWWVDWTIHLSVGGRLRPCILKLTRLEVATPPMGRQHSLDQGYLLVFSDVYYVFCRRQEGVGSEGRGDCDILSAGSSESEGEWTWLGLDYDIFTSIFV